MMNKIILDSNVIIGLYDKKDVWYRQAKKLLQGFEEGSLDLVFLDCVANEVFTVLSRRVKERTSQMKVVWTLKKLKSALPKEKITRSYQLLETHYEKVIDRIIESKGELNFHDALIITFALTQGIPFIASFDKNFDGIVGITRIFDPKILGQQVIKDKNNKKFS